MVAFPPDTNALMLHIFYIKRIDFAHFAEGETSLTRICRCVHHCLRQSEGNITCPQGKHRFYLPFR